MTTTTNKPLLLLDIDGCLNAHRFRQYNGAQQPKYKKKHVNGYTITYRPEWVEWVDGMVAVSDPIWATMWQEDALFHFAPKVRIGRSIERYIDFHAHYEEASEQRTGRGVGDYKHPGILVTVGDRPFIWIDDDISERQWEWALERTASGIPTLLIQPDPAVGLEWDHVAQVHKFIGSITIAA
jgi:hypothetical protein